MARATKAGSAVGKIGKTESNDTKKSVPVKADGGAKTKSVKGPKDGGRGAPSDRKGRFSVGSIKEFLREVRGEMRKVSWPSRKQLFASTSAVLLAILILGIYIGVLDYVFRSLSTLLNL